LLTAGDRSEHEIRTRLAARGHEAEDVDDTVQRLQRAGYLDDARVAEGVAAVGARRGYGSLRVRAQLRGRGIDAALISAAIQTSFADEPSLARQLLNKRYPSKPSTPAERGKAARFLAQRGFPAAIVMALVGED